MENENNYILGISGHVDEGMEEQFNSNWRLGHESASLKAIPNAWGFLNETLDAEDPLAALSRCLIPMDLTSHHNRFLLVMRVTLIDFCIMHLSNRNNRSADIPEKTFWVQSVVPMFKFFAGCTGLFNLDWCETPTIDHDTLTPAPLTFLDGLGTIKDKEILLLKASSAAIGEHVAHIRANTLKLEGAAAEILKAEAAKHQNSSFSSYLKLKVLTIHTVKNKMILSSVSYTKQKKYKIMELRTATVPLEWDERPRWFLMFDLLAHIMEILIEQKSVFEQLQQEGDEGGVLYEDTIRFRMET